MEHVSAAPGFQTANPHALAVILEASRTRSIIASRDIFDLSGTKLWARDQPVSQALQRKLMDRRLRHPLEACLQAEDGVTARSLVLSLDRLLDGRSLLAPLLLPFGETLVHAAQHLPMHPVLQLLLSAAQAARPERFDHAIEAMALAGALASGQGADTRDLRAAMLAGLMHDIGEMYIAPEHGEADADRTLDFDSFQHLVVHPHVGRLLIEQLTHYPADVSRAVAEHHERLDGSGYPLRLSGREVSPLGRLLAVVEAVLASLRPSGARLAHASVSVRLVPGEFDASMLGPLAAAVRRQDGLCARSSLPEVRERLSRIDRSLQSAWQHAGSLKAAAQAQGLRDAMTLAQHLLQRLHTGWIASGMWGEASVADEDAGEVEAVEDEVLRRLAAVRRAARLRAGDLPSGDALRLQAFCDGLEAVAC